MLPLCRNIGRIGALWRSVIFLGGKALPNEAELLQIGGGSVEILLSSPCGVILVS